MTGSIPIDAGVFVPPHPAPPPSQGRSRKNSVWMISWSRQIAGSELCSGDVQTGLGKAPEGFGGGVGEDQITSYLNQLRAEQMVEAGGIGLAESIFEDLKKQVMGDG